ncbi:MAG: hypothetical protein COB17_01845 [Sulfurimonas sp.]|nr:MAG: hypothetical protein COB17_01845 [Sulfurimonas sp.]
MSLLKTVAVNEADAKVKNIYEEINAAFGSIPNAFQFFSIEPKILEFQWNNAKDILSMAKENQQYYLLLEYIVSDDNKCDYCISLLKSMLINMFGMTNEQILEVKKDPSSAPLSKANIDLLLFTLKALKDSESVDASDIKTLENIGFTQKEIFNSVRTAGQIFMYNILFRTFKVEKDF